MIEDFSEVMCLVCHSSQDKEENLKATQPQCFICQFRGPGTKRGDGSGMWLEEGEVTEHSADHIGRPA